ncbi:MAG: hypothetical protein ACOCZK_04260 [Planctomycetota bacterium]
MPLTRTQYSETITKVGGYYNFVAIINRRLKELRNGEPPMLESRAGEDLVDLVVREIEADLLTWEGPTASALPNG